MIARVRSATVVGVQAVPIWIEVDVARGLPHFHLVGLPDSSVRESRDRVRASLRNSGFSFPVARITVNLAPGNIRKVGSAYDLPIALGILAAQGIISQHDLKDWIVMGELALDGKTRPVPGGLCAAIDLTYPSGDTYLMLPAENAPEIQLLPGLRAAGVHSLQHAVQTIRQAIQATQPPIQLQEESSDDAPTIPDPVVGQHGAKRALEIALAGGHHALMIGPPGSGKTLLSERLHHIVPELETDEALEVNRVYSAAGLLDGPNSLHRTLPLRSPHHTTTTRVMLGGGHPAVPGELSLAHRGILLLDEISLFRKETLEALRLPIQHGFMRITHDGMATILPSRTILIGTTNPCPCGWLGDAKNACSCSAAEVARFRRRLSGPLIDRLDLMIEVGRSSMEELTGDGTMDPAAPQQSLNDVRLRIANARKIQRRRNPEGELNGHCRSLLSEELGSLDNHCRRLVSVVANQFGLSSRGIHRMLRVARTIADLDEKEFIEAEHVAEASSYRVATDWMHRY